LINGRAGLAEGCVGARVSAIALVISVVLGTCGNKFAVVLVIVP